MTYNIQQGFDKVGNTALPQQLEAIRKVDPDVLGIEESDTARVANGNVDAVRYFADNLGMYSYYGPSTTVGTFGIALLSKYPIHAPETFFMYSTGEQTAAVWAIIKAQGKTYNVFVTHLGNDGPMIQLKNVLSRVDGGSNVILMGDFNFDPSTPQYALARQTLEDVWLVRWPHGHEIYPTGSEGRIDLMFVSPGTQITDAEYVSDGSSDHPYLYAVIKP
jgi:endonuclease/exonuclease/phosphatase family metal-dependent hydrolase